MAESKLDPTSVPVRAPTESGPGQRGDFDEFFCTQYRSIVRTLMLAGAGFEDADDAVQEAMTLAAGRFGQLDHPAAWVRQVARRSYIKRFQREQEVHRREQSVALLAATELDGGDELLVATVRAVLQALPPTQRTIMALSIDGYPPAEISRITGQPPVTVRSSLRHARKAMAAGLKKGGWNV